MEFPFIHLQDIWSIFFIAHYLMDIAEKYKYTLCFLNFGLTHWQ